MAQGQFTADGESFAEVGDRGERYFLDEQTDAFGITTYVIVEHGRFEEANWEWRMIPRSSRIVATFLDESEARVDLLQWRAS